MTGLSLTGRMMITKKLLRKLVGGETGRLEFKPLDDTIVIYKVLHNKNNEKISWVIGTFSNWAGTWAFNALTVELQEEDIRLLHNNLLILNRRKK